MRIRPVKLGDAPGISRVHIDSWRTTYRGIVPDQVLDSLDYDRNTVRQRSFIGNLGEMECFFVAEAAKDQIVGFAIGGPNRTENTGFSGELYGIYLLREFQRQGVGKLLVQHLAEWLLERGYDSMLVWVLDKNPSRRFYEALGGKYVSRKKIDIGGASLEEVSYGWSDLRRLIEDLKPKPAR